MDLSYIVGYGFDEVFKWPHLMDQVASSVILNKNSLVFFIYSDSDEISMRWKLYAPLIYVLNNVNAHLRYILTCGLRGCALLCLLWFNTDQFTHIVPHITVSVRESNPESATSNYKRSPVDNFGTSHCHHVACIWSKYLVKRAVMSSASLPARSISPLSLTKVTWWCFMIYIYI